MKNAAMKRVFNAGKAFCGRSPRSGLTRSIFVLSMAVAPVGCRNIDGISGQPAVPASASAKAPQRVPSSVRTNAGTGEEQSSFDASARPKTGTADAGATLGMPVAASADVVLASYQEKMQAASGPTSQEDQLSAVALSLDGALAQGLSANPDLVAIRGQVNVNRAVVGVAKTYPWNPFVQSQYFPNGHPFVPSNQPGGAVGASNYYVWAMQRIELAGQIKHRKESAIAALSQVEWNIQQAELNTVAQSMRLYFAALYQKELHDLAAESLDLHRKLANVVDQRFKANLAKAADVTTTKVALRQAARQTELAQATYQAAFLALRQQLNLPMRSKLAFPVSLENYRWNSLVADAADSTPPTAESTDFTALADELVEGRPDVMAAQAGVAISEANHRLSKAAMVPDLSAGPIYETGSDNTTFLGMRLQMDIPIWNNGLPLVRQRQAELGQQILTREQLKVRASLEAQASLNRYERARRLLIEAKSETTSKRGVSDEVQEITRQFQGGQADVLAVIAVQNALIQERRALLDLLNEVGQAAAAVVQTTALPPSRVIANVDAAPTGRP